MSDELRTDAYTILRLISDLIEQVAGTAISECEYRVADRRVLIRRSPSFVPQPTTPIPEGPEVYPAHWIPLLSPLTGIFYAADTPKAPPFVTVDSAIEVGQTIGLIEAMKTYNRVESDQAGIVRTVVVKNGSEVHTGQPLLYLEPDGAL